MSPTSEPLIQSIEVDQLFGLYSYRLPETGGLPNGAILYGDNGLGKTTILRAVFHLLSGADNKGHRGSLYRIPFKRLVVVLGSGATVTASREGEDLTGRLTLQVEESSKTLALWEFEPRSGPRGVAHELDEYVIEMGPDGRPRVRLPSGSRKSRQPGPPRGDKAYLAALEARAPVLFLLTADRRLESDSVADPSDELELRRVMMYEEPKRLNELVARAREIALSQALATTSRFIGAKALQSANRGSTNVHSVYVNVVRHLAAPPRRRNKESATRLDVADLLARLDAIESKTREHARYELATPLSTQELQEALRSGQRRALAVSLLAPYVESLEKRLEATNAIYRIVDRLVTLVNAFLTDKMLVFHLGQGFTIQNRLGRTLEPPQLSSGEQQLLLLFCYIITGRDRPSVFMVDEPELSLNIKWQRQLITSLLELAEDSPTQFIFASHSLELLAQHRNRVVRLANRQ